MKSNKIGLIAASGILPEQIIQACQRQQAPLTIIALKGVASSSLEEYFPSEQRQLFWLPMGKFHKTVSLFKKNKVEKVVLAGALKRPSIRHMRMGLKDFFIFRRVVKNTWHGDNSLLSSIIKELQRQGFEVIGVQDIMNELLVPEGCLGSIQPSQKAWHDINRGYNVAKTLGQVDVGQGVVIQNGVVLGLEGIEGTNGLINRCGLLKSNDEAKPILVKVCKPQQDQRIDLPTIGPETIENLYKAGFAGVAVESQKTLVLNIDTVIKLADQYKIFVIGVAMTDSPFH